MATTTGLTVKEFLALSLPTEERVELVKGEIVKMGNAGGRHERVKANANEILVLFVAQHRIGKVFSESMFELADTEARIPDVSLVLTDQIRVPAVEGPLTGAPALAIEIVSSEKAADLEAKVELYLEKGSRTVLVLYPEQRAVRVFEKTGVSRLLRGDQPVEIDWLPGFSVPTSRFFEGV